MFNEVSWLAVLTGQDAPVTGHDPICDALPIAIAAKRLAQIERVVATSLTHMPPHATALAQLATNRML